MDFHWYALKWCNNTKNAEFSESVVENSISGNPLIESPYSYKFGTHKSGIIPCEKEFNLADINQFSFMMQHNYNYKLYLDGLPSVTVVRDADGESILDYYGGIPVGYYDQGQLSGESSNIIYNHLDITVETHQTAEGHQRIVAFDVEPFSLKDDENRFIFSQKYQQPHNVLEVDKKVTFTYSITTRVNKNLTWQTRLDHYMKTGNDDIHLMQLIVSFSIVLVIGIIVAMILKRVLNKDFSNIEMAETRRDSIKRERIQAKRDGKSEEEIKSLVGSRPLLPSDDVAWKKLQGEVVRVPAYPMLLSFLMGTGT